LLDAPQSPVEAQPQLPLGRQAVPFALALQSAHAPPLWPHCVCAVPAMQLVPSQQPPLQLSPPAHDVVHTPDALQALPVGQSAEVAQPQLPPRHFRPSGDEAQSPAPLQPQLPPPRQAVPLAFDVQLLQLPPDGPHAFGALPGWQVVPSQQPLQVSPPAHDEVHLPEALHAFAVGQLAAPLQPHTPLTRQRLPLPLVVQSVHAPPTSPHAAC
jgi:hypothetical protein